MHLRHERASKISFSSDLNAGERVELRPCERTSSRPPRCYLLEVLVIQAPREPLTEPQLHFVQTQLQEVVDQGDLEAARHK